MDVVSFMESTLKSSGVQIFPTFGLWRPGIYGNLNIYGGWSLAFRIFTAVGV